VKALVLGYGSIGRRHVAALAGVVEVAVVEPDATLRDRVRAAGVRDVFDDIRAGAAWGPDAVVIATPTHLHAECHKAVASLGCPTLIEKPIAHDDAALAYFEGLSPGESERIAVMANMRCHAGPETLRDNLDRIGRPRSAYVQFGSYLPDMRPGVDYRSVYASHRDQGGGVLLDCIHEFDYLQWLFGEPVLKGAHLSRLSLLDMDVEDHAVVLLDYPDGPRALVELDFLQRHKFRGCRIAGDLGTLVWLSRAKAPEIVDVAFYTAEAREPETLFRDDGYDLNGAYGKYLDAFLTFARTGETGCLLDAATAAREVRLLLSVIAQSPLDS
jgi:predicted dehydrogenase